MKVTESHDQCSASMIAAGAWRSWAVGWEGVILATSGE